MLDRTIKVYEQVIAQAGFDNRGFSEGDRFSRSVKLFRSIRPGWEAKLLQGSQRSAAPVMPEGFQNPTPPQDLPLPELSVPEEWSWNLDDDDWFLQFLTAPG